jgi:hypothetical protein
VTRDLELDLVDDRILAQPLVAGRGTVAGPELVLTQGGLVAVAVHLARRRADAVLDLGVGLAAVRLPRVHVRRAQRRRDVQRVAERVQDQRARRERLDVQRAATAAAAPAPGEAPRNRESAGAEHEHARAAGTQLEHVPTRQSNVLSLAHPSPFNSSSSVHRRPSRATPGKQQRGRLMTTPDAEECALSGRTVWCGRQRFCPSPSGAPSWKRPFLRCEMCRSGVTRDTAGAPERSAT